MKPINVFSTGSFDAAGVNERFAKAWNKYGFGTWRTYFMQDFRNTGADMLFKYSTTEDVEQAMSEADIFIFNVIIDEGAITTHLINDWDTVITPPIEHKVKYIFQYAMFSGKPIIFYLNGSSNVRQWNDYYNQLFKLMNVKLACSTPDLTGFYPTAKYFPSFIDVEDDFWNIEKIKSDIKTIGHFPTNPEIKNTREYLQLKQKLQNELKFEMVRGVSYGNSVNIKRDMDFTFDHLQGYYGINSLEASALGIINFVRLDDFNKEQFCNVSGVNTYPWNLVEDIRDVKKELDFYLANEDELEKRQREVKEWMKNNWNAEKHCKRMYKYFEELQNEDNNNS